MISLVYTLIGMFLFITVLSVVVMCVLFRVVNNLKMEVETQEETIEILQDRVHEHTDEIAKILFLGGNKND